VIVDGSLEPIVVAISEARLEYRLHFCFFFAVVPHFVCA